MASLSTLQKFQNLGFKIVKMVSENGTVRYRMADPGNYGNVAGLYVMPNLTEKDIADAGLSDIVVEVKAGRAGGAGAEVTTEDLGAAGIGGAERSKGDFTTISSFETGVLNKLVSNIENALKENPNEQIIVGNQTLSRSQASNMIGESKSVQFDESRLEARNKASEEANAALDAKQKQESKLFTPSERTGRSLKGSKQADGTYNIVDSNTGEVVEKGLADATMANARMTQLQSGGTPSLGGRPDLYAIEPTQQERNIPGLGRAFAPYVDPATGQTVTPSVATPDQMQQFQAGTLENYPTAIAGGAGGIGADDLTTTLEGAVATSETSALADDPSLVVTPEMRAAWLQEALDDLRNNRAYAEVIRNTEFDLGQSLNRLVEDTRLREIAAAQEYKTKLKAQTSSLQDRGFLYGGEGGGIRGQEERELADVTNLGLQGLQTQFRRGLEDYSQQAERTLGSGPYGGFTQGAGGLQAALGTTQNVGRVIAGSPIYQTGGTIPVLSTLGGQYGELPRTIQTEALTRAEEKEGAFRDTFSQYA